MRAQAAVDGAEYGGIGRPHAPDGLYATPVVTIRPSHSAPLDLVFYYGRQFPASYRGGAFGGAPWRQWSGPPGRRARFDVMFIPFTGGGKPGTPMTFIDGFAGPTPASEYRWPRPPTARVAPWWRRTARSMSPRPTGPDLAHLLRRKVTQNRPLGRV